MSKSYPVELIEQIFDSLGDVVYCMKDRQGRYQSVNVAFVERVKVDDKSELIGKSAIDFFPHALAEVYEAQDETVFMEGRPLLDQLERITNSTGSMGWYLASKFPMRDEDGNVNALIGISQDLHTPSDSDLEIANLKTVVEFIKSNLDESLRTEQLADSVGLSQTQLDRRMKRIFRLSTKKFIMKCRLEEASRRLISTVDPLSEIALACGFTDQSAFTRQFRAAAAMPPLTFRKKHSNKS